MRFAHLHLHTVYSVKDAIAHPIDYLKRVYEYNDSQTEHELLGFAITEHSNLFSMVEHYNNCTTPQKWDKKNRTVKPIFGNEVYHVPDLNNYDFKVKGHGYNHLVLIAKNEVGMKNLIKITSHAGLNKYKSSKKDYQITDDVFLKEHGKGVIALSACIQGIVPRLIIDGKYDEAKAKAIEFSNIFDTFYLELQPHDMPEQKLANEGLLKIHEETNIPIIMTTDSHYIYKEDRKYHDLMMDIDNGYHYKTDNHFWTVDELIEWCTNNNIPLECLENTAKVYDSCNVDIKPSDEKGLMPDYPCPSGYDENSYLIKLANEGLKERFKTNKHIVDDFELYSKRLNYELYIIMTKGFSGYFIILWDWFKWCKQNGILLGPGRGSAAGSLVAYSLNITNLDPIKNGYIFERFLSPERHEMPDEV